MPTFSCSELSKVNPLGSLLDQFFDLIHKDGKTLDVQSRLHKLECRSQLKSFGAALTGIKFLDISTDFLLGQSVNLVVPRPPFDDKGLSKRLIKQNQVSDDEEEQAF